MKAFIFILALIWALTMAVVGLHYITRPAGILALIMAALFGWLAKCSTEWHF